MVIRIYTRNHPERASPGAVMHKVRIGTYFAASARPSITWRPRHGVCVDRSQKAREPAPPPRGQRVQKLALGTVLQIGDVLLKLEQPRKPCYVLDAIDPRLKDAIVGRCGFMAQLSCQLLAPACTDAAFFGQAVIEVHFVGENRHGNFEKHR
jgi:hypothetical protein